MFKKKLDNRSCKGLSSKMIVSISQFTRFISATLLSTTSEAMSLFQQDQRLVFPDVLLIHPGDLIDLRVTEKAQQLIQLIT
jgi:hypothetical protein